MPISDAMQKAFNEQIQKEFASAYLYLSMSAYFESLSLDGPRRHQQCGRAHHHTRPYP